MNSGDTDLTPGLEGALGSLQQQKAKSMGSLPDGTPPILGSGSENGASNIDTRGTQTNKSEQRPRTRSTTKKLDDAKSKAKEGQDRKAIRKKLGPKSVNKGKMGSSTVSKSAPPEVVALAGAHKVEKGPPPKHHS